MMVQKAGGYKFGQIYSTGISMGDTWNFHFPRKAEIGFDFKCDNKVEKELKIIAT